MTWAFVAVGGAIVTGAVISSNAAGNAATTQANAAAAAGTTSAAGTTGDRFGWLSFLRNPLLLALLAVSLLPLAVMGLSAYRAAAATLDYYNFDCFHETVLLLTVLIIC